MHLKEALMRYKMLLIVLLFSGVLVHDQRIRANGQVVPAPVPITVTNVKQLKAPQSISLDNFPDATSENFPVSMAFDPFLKRAAGVIDQGTIRIWDLATG